MKVSTAPASLGVGLFLASQAAAAPLQSRKVASKDALPVDFSNTVFANTFDRINAGAVYTGPFVQEGSSGVSYGFGSITSADGSVTECFYESITSAGAWIKRDILDYTNHYLPPGDCFAMDSTYGADGCIYLTGTSGGEPFVTKFCNNGHSTDPVLVSNTVQNFPPFLVGNTIQDATVAVSASTGNVYTAWSVLSANGTSFVTVLKYAKTTGAVSLFYTLGGVGGSTAAAPVGIKVLQDETVVIAGTTNQALNQAGLPALAKSAAFVAKLKDFGGNVGSLEEFSTHHLGSDATTGSALSIDGADGSIYLAVVSQVTGAGSGILKLEPVVPFSNVTLPVKQIRIPGTATTAVAISKNSVYIGTLTDDAGKQIYVADSELSQKSPIKMTQNQFISSSLAIGQTTSQIASIAVSKFDVGTLIVGLSSLNYQAVVTKVGYQASSVKIHHKKTGLYATMTNDGRVLLFPEDSNSKNQIWNRELLHHAFVNAGLGQALTAFGKPQPCSTYRQEDGHNVVGAPFKASNKAQRWGYKDSRITSLMDKLCIGLDRNYLANHRFPNGNVGLPMITVPCTSDKLQEFEVIHA
ncbi:hypothetical protein HK101_003367 [Irineochytrium annulatum]|nr:hypothetical protein HK101_003367 [Irineochytrium annulatum]